ncbi:hypothetical protein DUI87_16744 [Hirundo rustica rustica]|uniref:Uncharacterized protein n=1 Tax=Hirundo rustica rustica TaxID=333673 RepID=A0A3M0K2B4_HIRRU|nr:hypothetical protein DUI87_16744 [Hirundo rustica rustica]
MGRTKWEKLVDLAGLLWDGPQAGAEEECEFFPEEEGAAEICDELTAAPIPCTPIPPAPLLARALSLIIFVSMNQTGFNKTECQVLHFGNDNPMQHCRRRAVWLESDPAEKDLGMQQQLNMTQSVPRAKKTNDILSRISNSVASSTTEVTLLLYSGSKFGLMSVAKVRTEDDRFSLAKEEN